MVTQVQSATLFGIEALPVTVEISQRSGGLPKFDVIGLGDTAVKEARHRVQSALAGIRGWQPTRPIMINLAPADVRKDGAALDLPMALGLIAEGDPPISLADTVVVGELGLAGEIRPIRGALAVAALAAERGAKRLILPTDNHHEASAVGGLKIVSAESLQELVAVLEGRLEASVPPQRTETREHVPELAEVRGHATARRVLEIAAAGGHNILMRGPPGCGKTMLARRLPGLLPRMTEFERVEVTKVWSAAGLKRGRTGLVDARPFRAPHPSISQAGLIGGGPSMRPGEVSLAHRGVLFLDEIPEMPRRVLEALRQPVEDRTVTISRVRQSVLYPASFMLVAAMNPCPCGYQGHPVKPCSCPVERVRRYQQRLSGPLLDRFDLTVDVPAVATETLFDPPADTPTSTQEARARVVAARLRAIERQGCVNAELNGRALDRATETGALSALRAAAERLSLSARGVFRVRRVARSIADLQGEENVARDHVLEALQYRELAS